MLRFLVLRRLVACDPERQMLATARCSSGDPPLDIFSEAFEEMAHKNEDGQRDDRGYGSHDATHPSAHCACGLCKNWPLHLAPRRLCKRSGAEGDKIRGTRQRHPIFVDMDCLTLRVSRAMQTEGRDKGVDREHPHEKPCHV